MVQWQRWLAALLAGLAATVASVALGNAVMVPAAGAREEGTNWALDAAERAAVADKLAAALRVPTVSQDPAGERTTDTSKLLGLAKLLRDRFPHVHTALKLTVVNNYSLLYEWRSPEGDAKGLNPVMLCAHLDVVPVEESDLSKWLHEPFAGVVDSDGTVWGRGAIDDKHNVVGQLQAVERLLERGFKPARTVLLAFGHDEEIGGRNGAKQLGVLIKQKYGRVAFVLDEGLFVIKGVVPGLAKPCAFIGTVEKGYVTVKLSVDTVPPGHSSMPPFETNVGILSNAMARLERTPCPAHVDMYSRHLKRLAPQLTLPMRVVVANPWLFSRVLKRVMLAKPTTATILRTTTAITILRAGAKINAIPGLAVAYVNHRIHPSDRDGETVLAHNRRVVADPRVKVEFSLDSKGASDYLRPSPETSADAPGFKLLARTVRRVFDNAPVMPSTMVGNTDTRWYWDLTDEIYRHSPVLMASVDDTKMFHGNNERITSAQLSHVVAFYTELIDSLADLPS